MTTALRTRRRDPAREHLLGGAAAPSPRASYDAAKNTTENRKHWLDADNLGPVSELTPEGRRTLRARGRHEAKNNSYMAGAIRTIVADTVGTGARLQMLTPDRSLNTQVEDLWTLWAAAADWPLNTRVLVGVGEVVGECLAIFRDSKKLARYGIPVTLDLRLIEPDQCASPWGSFAENEDDGVIFDADGEAEKFRILKDHPGDGFSFGTDSTVLDAVNVIQWFEPTRPGQLRGVSPWVSALPVFNQLRRFTQATLTAAEVASMLAGVMTFDNLPMNPESYIDGMADPDNFFDTFAMVRGMLLTLPPGAKAEQFKPEQPTTNYEMFVRTKLREIGRCRNMSYGRISGDYSQYSYSSVRSEDGPYWHDRDIHRQALEAKVFDRFLYRWLSFAKYAIPALQKYDGEFWRLKHRWQYDARPTSDPVKDASGDELNLTNGADTLTAILARDGTTLEETLDSRARERDEFLARGLALPPWMAATSGAAPARDENGRAVNVQPPSDAAPADQPAEGDTVATDKAATNAAAASGDVQGTALNGAQIVALDAICAKLPTGEYPEDGVESLIQAAYPLMDKALIHDFVSSFAAHEPAPQEEPANA